MDLNLYLYIAVVLVIAYLLGSIPSAVWIGKRFYGVDVREHGSHNAGSTNTLRVLGRKAAIPVFILDILKGFVAVTLVGALTHFVAIDDVEIINIRIVTVFVAVLGHIFPIFAQFKGGKGVATLVGSVAGIYPPIILMCFIVWLLVMFITHYVSLSSMIAGCSFPIFTLLTAQARESVPFVVFSFVVAVLLIITHRKNIGRLRAGTESKTYFGKNRDQEGNIAK